MGPLLDPTQIITARHFAEHTPKLGENVRGTTVHLLSNFATGQPTFIAQNASRR
jgi:hypothetical protein